ncbi:MAG: acyl-CoA dehydrogenase family protein [Mycobacteriales bacterium]
MDFAFSAEQEMLRSAARAYLQDRYPPARVIELADSETGWDPASWAELAEMGWLDPELGVLEQAVLFEETGAALYPGPLLTSVGLSGSVLPAEVRSAVGAGERSVTVAVAEPGGPITLGEADRVATRADANCRLSGHKILVPDLALVSDVLVVANGAAGPGLYLVAASAGEVVMRDTIDATRRLGELRLDGAPGSRVGGPEEIVRMRQHGLAALACEAVGVAQHALDLAAEHAKTREQFGRIIGTYQGVSHRVANVYMDCQLARSLAYWAAWCVAEGDAAAPQALAAAKAASGAAAVSACENAIQIHGGVGFTWEHELHRYYKRAQWIDAYEGAGRAQRAGLATALLD